MVYFVYVLRCSGPTYYVGTTQKSNFTIMDQPSCPWTNIYIPFEVKKIIEVTSRMDELKVVLECMHEYGIENVRGGPFSNIHLSDRELFVIREMLDYYYYPDRIVMKREYIETEEVSISLLTRVMNLFK